MQYVYRCLHAKFSTRQCDHIADGLTKWSRTVDLVRPNEKTLAKRHRNKYQTAFAHDLLLLVDVL